MRTEISTFLPYQWIKRRACGFRNRERFRNALYFHLGGLDLYPATDIEEVLRHEWMVRGNETSVKPTCE